MRPAGKRAEQAGGVAAADGGDRVLVKPRRRQPPNRVLDAHVEGVVAAERHLAGSHHGDQVTQLPGRVDERVGEGLPEQLAGRPLGRPRVGARGPRVIRAHDVARQVASAVGRPDLQAGMPFQQAGKDDAGQGERGLHRVADGIEQVVGIQPAAQRAAPRVDQHGGPEFLGRRPEPGQARVVQFHARRGRGGDLHAPHAQRGDRMAQLLRGQVRMLQGDGSHRKEPRWLTGAELGDRIVGHRDDLLGERPPGPRVRLGHRGDGLDVDASGVHRREPQAQVGQPGNDLAEMLPVIGHRGVACRDRVDALLLGVTRLASDQRLHPGHRHVGVDVDGWPGARGRPRSPGTGAVMPPPRSGSPGRPAR